MAKILVIEDEAILRNEIVEWLTLEDYEALGAEDGEAGVAAALQHRPDLIISDITMPRLDGYGVLLEIHSHEATANIPFIFVTARVAHDDVRHGMNLGADDYITKPFTRLELLQTIRSRLAKKMAQEQEQQRQVNLLQQALMQEHEQLLLKTKLVAMFSHDLRNPLSSILITNSLIRDYGKSMDENRRVAHLNHVEASVRMMVRMLDDTLLIAQLETGNFRIKLEPLDVGQFFQPILADFQVTCGEDYSIHFENRVSEPVIVDARLLRQIAINLISNAVKYSTPGGAIHVLLAKSEQTYILTVQDQGIGIPEADQARLFDAFHRGANVGKVPGTGLGLAIVKQAIDLHGGTIQLESQVNIGTTIRVYIPHRQSEGHQGEGRQRESS